MHKKMDVLIIFIMVNLLISFMFDLLPFFLPSFLQLQQRLATFMCHGFFIFATRESLQLLFPQNPLDHDNGYCKLVNKPYGYLKAPWPI